ncbi:MAG: hypothetical protein Q4B67_08960 [Eubacteriales bacterium]|nr:hypothetical protein [Eubacteriales bacterium]
MEYWELDSLDKATAWDIIDQCQENGANDCDAINALAQRFELSDSDARRIIDEKPY